MIELIGMDNINRILQRPEFRFYDPKQGGGLWVGKPYAKNTVRKGDPLFNISHGATVNQVCRLYYQLATGKIINEKRSRQMLEILKTPLLYHKFVYELQRRSPDARIYRKSGTWKTWHADSVFVRDSQWRNYILVALVESDNGEKIIRELVPTIEQILHPE